MESAGHGGADAKAGEQVDDGNSHATDNDSLGNIASGIGHVVGHGADDLEAHEVEDDNRQVAEGVGVGEFGQEGGSGHVVRKTVLHGIPDAQGADDNGYGDLDDGASVEDPLGVGRLGAAMRYTIHTKASSIPILAIRLNSTPKTMPRMSGNMVASEAIHRG